MAPSQFVELLLAQDRELRYLEQNDAIVASSLALSQEVEEIHGTIKGKIDDFFPDRGYGTTVLHRPNTSKKGFLVVLPDRTLGIMVRSSVASLEHDEAEFAEFREVNPTHAVTPVSHFSNIVAHEYGHIIDRDFRSAAYEGSYSRSLPSHLREAFAFWFGDTISDLNSPLDSLSDKYKRKGIKFDKTIATYHRLKEAAEKEGTARVLEPENLYSILHANN